MKVKSNLVGKTVVVHDHERGKQDSFVLANEYNDVVVEEMILKGVDVSHFDPQDDREEKRLKRIAENAKLTKSRLFGSTTVNTKLVFKKQPVEQEQIETPTVDKTSVKFILLETVGFEEIANVMNASAEELAQRADLKAIKKALGLRSNTKVEKLYDLIHA